MYITILNEGNSVPPKMDKKLSDYLMRRCKIHPHKVKINKKLAQKYKNKKLDQNNSSSESPEITPEEIESVKRLVIVSVKLLVANWINKFVDAKLNEYTVNTMTRYKTNKVLYDYIRNQIDQVYIKHPNYRKCSVEQFKKESIWNYLLSEFRDKSKKEIANELAWYGVDEVILFACSEFIPLPGSVVLAVPVKMGLSYVGCKFGNALYELPFEFDGNMITVGLSLSVLKYSERGDNIIKFIFTNKLYILSALLFIIICLIIGDRGPVLYLGTVMASVYILFVKKLKTYVIILSCLIAILLMFLIRETRGTSSSISSGGIASFFENSNESLLGVNSLWNVFVDLTDIHNEMTIGYEYVQKKGVIYPEKIVIVPFYPIPKVPSILSNLLYEKSFNDISSGKVIQQYVSSAIIWNSGTHCVMDIYIHWGIVGVFLFFFVFGFFVGTIYKQSTHNLFCTIIYIAIIAESIYLPRSSILSIVRTVVYVTMTIYICVKCCKKEIIIKESKCHQF